MHGVVSARSVARAEPGARTSAGGSVRSTGSTAATRGGGPSWRRLTALALITLGLSMPVRAWEPERLMQQAARAGGQALHLAQQLVDVVAQAGRTDEEQRLVVMNQFFNRRILFRDDIEVWGQVDHWASPVEVFARGQGDCEDYAIGKYFSLIAAGVAPVKLRLVYVKAVIGGQGGVQQAHMVLAYYATPNADPLILDNLIGDIRPASRRPDLTPVFSFNADGIWQGTQGAGVGDAVARLSRWREILVKAREQGFL